MNTTDVDEAENATLSIREHALGGVRIESPRQTTALQWAALACIGFAIGFTALAAETAQAQVPAKIAVIQPTGGNSDFFLTTVTPIQMAAPFVGGDNWSKEGMENSERLPTISTSELMSFAAGVNGDGHSDGIFELLGHKDWTARISATGAWSLYNGSRMETLELVDGNRLPAAVSPSTGRFAHIWFDESGQHRAIFPMSKINEFLEVGNGPASPSANKR